MQCLKVMFLLLPGVFSKTVLDKNTSPAGVETISYTVRQVGVERVAFEVTYSNMGKNFTEFSGYFSTGEERTINIPPEATNSRIHACYTEDRPCKRDFFWQPFRSPTSCIILYSPDHHVEQPKCKPRPAEGYSITVHQVGDYKSLFEVEYSFNNSVKTHSSGEILNGQSKTIGFPDGATYIGFTLYAYNSSQSSKEKIAYKVFRYPVKKCFESRNGVFFDDEWHYYEKACQKLQAGTNNSISVRQTSSSKIQIIVTYSNTYELTEMYEFSDEFSRGENRSIQIPNESDNIMVLLKKRDFNGTEAFEISRYDWPVKKCFKANISSNSNNWSEESCQA